MATLPADDSLPFSPLERKRILALLEEFTSALAIYHNALKKPAKHDNDISIDCLPIDTDELKMFSPEELAKIEEARERAISAKHCENSLYIRNIMEELKEEIRSQGTFDVLTKEIDKIMSHENEETALLMEQERLQKTAVELQKLLADEKVANEEEKKRILRELAEEQRSVEKLKLIADAELKYVTDWGNARCEQNSLRCTMEVENLEKKLNDWRVREKNDERVHDGLAKFLIQETASLEEKTKEWEERYAREKEMYENEIRQLRIEIETRRKELDEAKEEYRRNQEFIDMCLNEKEAKRKEKELQERIHKSAIKIQAWWRGVMVRRKLGPYRPAEKKKKRQAKTKK